MSIETGRLASILQGTLKAVSVAAGQVNNAYCRGKCEHAKDQDNRS